MAVNENCPVKDPLALMDDWPLDRFLELQEVVEIATAIQMADFKDREAELENNK